MEDMNRTGEGKEEKSLRCDPGSELRRGGRENMKGEEIKWGVKKEGEKKLTQSALLYPSRCYRELRRDAFPRSRDGRLDQERAREGVGGVGGAGTGARGLRYRRGEEGCASFLVELKMQLSCRNSSFQAR